MLKQTSPTKMGLRGYRRAFPVEVDSRTALFRAEDRLQILDRLLRGVREFQKKGTSSHIKEQAASCAE